MKLAEHADCITRGQLCAKRADRTSPVSRAGKEDEDARKGSVLGKNADKLARPWCGSAAVRASPASSRGWDPQLLKQLLDSFIKEHEDYIDTKRIYLTGQYKQSKKLGIRTISKIVLSTGTLQSRAHKLVRSSSPVLTARS